jgi:hypothetical protein
MAHDQDGMRAGLLPRREARTDAAQQRRVQAMALGRRDRPAIIERGRPSSSADAASALSLAMAPLLAPEAAPGRS